jgi:hypothetical protein
VTAARPPHQPARPATQAQLPKVTFLIGALQREAAIEAKLHDTLALDYARELLEVRLGLKRFFRPHPGHRARVRGAGVVSLHSLHYVTVWEIVERIRSLACLGR